MYTAIIELKYQNDNPIRMQGAPPNITDSNCEAARACGAAAATAIRANRKANGTCEIVLQPKEPGHVRLCVQMNEQKILLDMEVLRLTAQPKTACSARALPMKNPKVRRGRGLEKEANTYDQGIDKPIWGSEQKKQKLHSCLVDSQIATVITSG